VATTACGVRSPGSWVKPRRFAEPDRGLDQLAAAAAERAVDHPAAGAVAEVDLEQRARAVIGGGELDALEVQDVRERPAS
jgi:hypothetical protein